MKKTTILTFAALATATLITGCGSMMPSYESQSATIASASECSGINKKLIQVNNYIVKVNGMSAFHLEEAAAALPNLSISTSTNKRTMLRDANRKKENLLREQKQRGCTPVVTEKK